MMNLEPNTDLSGSGAEHLVLHAQSKHDSVETDPFGSEVNTEGEPSEASLLGELGPEKRKHEDDDVMLGSESMDQNGESKSPPLRRSAKRSRFRKLEDNKEDNIEYPAIAIPPRDNLKAWEDPIYAEFPNFNLSWIIRTMTIKFQKYQYVTKHELNQTVHNSLRRSLAKNEAKFSIGHIMNAIKYLAAEKDPLIVWHFPEEEYTKSPPPAFKLTDEGRKFGLLLHEQKQQPLKVLISEPPKNRKKPSEDDSVEDFNFEAHAKRLVQEYKRVQSENWALKEELKRLNAELALLKQKGPEENPDIS